MSDYKAENLYGRYTADNQIENGLRCDLCIIIFRRVHDLFIVFTSSLLFATTFLPDFNLT